MLLLAGSTQMTDCTKHLLSFHPYCAVLQSVSIITLGVLPTVLQYCILCQTANTFSVKKAIDFLFGNIICSVFQGSGALMTCPNIYTFNDGSVLFATKFNMLEKSQFTSL